MSKVSTIDRETGQMVIGNAIEERKKPKNSFFDGAKVDRFTADWITQDASMDSLLEGSISRLRARSRSLCVNDGYAANWLAQTVANVIGDGGFRLKMTAKNLRGIGPDKRANKLIEKAWKDFCKAENFSVTEDMTAHAYDVLNLRSIATAGGCLTRMIRGYGGNKYKFAVQGINIDHLDSEYHDAVNRISMSVQKNGWGKTTAYHVLRVMPSDQFGRSAIDGPRDVFGADEVIHPFIREEFGQSQGKPWLTPVIPRLRQLHGYEEAELIAARAHASKLGFFETDPLSNNAGYEGEGEDSIGNIVMDGSPGSFETLPPGVSANLIDPSHPNANYPDFRKGMLRGVAAGIVTNYNLLGQDLEGVNYSSIRQGVIAEREMWKLVQRWYIDEFKAPLFKAWLEWSILTGQLPFSMTDVDRLTSFEFTGRRWDWIDPDKDSRAEERRLKNRLTSHQRIARSRGEDHEEILEEVKEDNSLASAKQLDLFLDLEGNQPEQASDKQPPKPEKDEDG